MRIQTNLTARIAATMIVLVGDLTRVDLDFDLPDQFLPEFPPPVFLTTRVGL